MKLCWEATGGAPGSCVRGPLAPTYEFFQDKQHAVTV